MSRKFILPLILLIEILAIQVISFFPEFVERYYSNGFYPKVAELLRIGLGKLPFSFGDCLYAILIIALLRWIWKFGKTRKVAWRGHLLQILSALAIFYFFFNFCWGINYCRQPLFEKLSIERDYCDADLLDFTKRLIKRTNEVHSKIVKNDSLAVVFPYSREEVFKMTLNGYDRLSLQYPEFRYQNLSVKSSLFSLPLTYMGFGGYLNPFTNEAQVNYLGPMYSFPATTCHEMAHQIGFASESECNFIGFLASIKNDDLYFRYSGYSLALRYCLRNWEARNEKIYEQLRKTIHPGILKNFQESIDFWQQYETFIEVGFHVFYDNFLKFNQQEDGLESYSKFVNLLVGYYRELEL